MKPKRIETIKKPIQLTVLFLTFIVLPAAAQTKISLAENIQQIISTKNAVVGVSISGNDGKEIMSVNGDEHFPLQSVFKLHIALAVLSEVDKGKLSLDQRIKIRKGDLLPGLYSPIRDEYPEGVTLTLAEILEYTVSASDNAGCDVLLRLLGGPEQVEHYFTGRNFKDISIKFNEEVQQGNWNLQFQNWTTPKSANRVLSAFYDNDTKLLSQTSYEFIWKLMRETSTGARRLKGLLPAGTMVAHKTGSSGTNKATGITAAVNDIGIVFLPNGQHFFISVFVTDSKEDLDTNERIIAGIGKVAWDFFLGK